MMIARISSRVRLLTCGRHPMVDFCGCVFGEGCGCGFAGLVWERGVMVFLQRLRPWAARLAFVVEGVGCGANDECAAGFHSDQTSKVRKAGSALDPEHWRAGRTSRLVKVICDMKLLLARQDPIVTGTSRRFRDILCLLFNRDFGKN